MALVRNYEQLEGSPETKTFWQKIKETIDFILDLIKGIDYVSLNTAADSIARDILSNNYKKLDRLLKDTSNYNLLSYSETIKLQNQKDGGKALKFMQWFCEKGMIITGSLSYRLQGETFRPEIDALHDIDNVVPLEVHNLFIYPEMFSEQIQDTLEPSLTTGTLRINAEKLSKKIPVLRELKQEFPNTEFMYAYTNTKQGNSYLTINAIWSENQELKNRFKSYTGSFNDRLAKFTEKELNQIYLFDFFLTPRLSSDYITIVDQDYNLTLNHFAESFTEKQGTMGRPKDAYDYQRWKPFEGTIPAPVDFKSNLTYFQLTPSPYIKPGVEELFKSNPELANAVYEALGFENDTSTTIKDSIIQALNSGKTIELPLSLLEKIKEFDRTVLDDTNNNIGKSNIQKLKKDIKENGLKEPLKIIINSKGNILLVEGNHRIIALKELGYEKVPVVVTERDDLLKNILKEKAEQEYYYRDGNKLGLNLYKDFNTQITPQQKQQALQLYSQYLDTATTPTIKGFKAFAGGTTEVTEATETTVDTQEALEEFKSQNPNMPDEDIEDYFASCKL